MEIVVLFSFAKGTRPRPVQASRTTWPVAAERAIASRSRTVSRAWSAGQHSGASSATAATKLPSMLSAGSGRATARRGASPCSSTSVRSVAWSRPLLAEIGQFEELPGGDARDGAASPGSRRPAGSRRP